MAIPRGDITVSDRPINSEPVPKWTFKIEITPTLCMSCPSQRFSSHLITSYPVERFSLDIWMFLIFGKKMHRILLECTTPGSDRVFLFNIQREHIAMLKLPRHFIGRRIILYMFNVSSSFQDESFQSFFC